MEHEITYNDLPAAVSRMSQKIDEIKTILAKQEAPEPIPEENNLLTLKETAEFLHLSTATIYSKISREELPGVYKQGKRLYFDKQILTDWIRSGRKKSNAEIEQEAEEHLASLKKKGLNNGK